MTDVSTSKSVPSGLGDKLFPLILQKYQSQTTAGKLTGMLMDAVPAHEIQRAIVDDEVLTSLLSQAAAALGVPPSTAGASDSIAEEVAATKSSSRPGDVACREIQGQPLLQEPAAPKGPKDLLNAIQWHHGITFANIVVDFKKRKSSGKLSKRVSSEQFITFAFRHLETTVDAQIEQISWKSHAFFTRKQGAPSIHKIDIEGLELSGVERGEANMINGIIEGRKAERPKHIEKVASGQAKFQRTPSRKAETLLEYLSRMHVDPSDISLDAVANETLFLEEPMRRAAESVSSWAKKVDQYCWKGRTRFELGHFRDSPVTLLKSTEFSESGFGLSLLSRKYVCIWVSHRFDFETRVNRWTLGFHHLDSGSRISCKLITPGTPKITQADDRVDGDKTGNTEWTAELWATTNFPRSKMAKEKLKRLMTECKFLENNFVKKTGSPE